MNGYRILARVSETDVAQGTGWLLEHNVICTAFHVVGSCADGRWLHQNLAEATYELHGAMGTVQLRPLIFDPISDIALLSGSGLDDVPLPLADASRRNVPWQATGFPGFHHGKPFTLSGSVVELQGGESSRTVQLLVNQETEVSWDGVSGAAVLDDGRVTAVITNVTSGTSTGWGASVSALHGLIAMAHTLTHLRRFTEQRYAGADLDRWLSRLEAPDAHMIPDLVESLRRERDQDPDISALLPTLRQFEHSTPSLAIPPDQLLALREHYGVMPVRDGARRFRPRPSREFEEIFRGNGIFGGRRPEIARLDRFTSMQDRGYSFITGPSGFGKTALLARWIELLRRRGEAVCFHFFTGRIPDSLDTSQALGRLCEQLLAFHDLGGDLPRDRPALQNLYADLLSAPAPNERPLVVVLDALDEALERPGPRLFPSGLGLGVHVVFSARPLAGLDWLSTLGLPLDDGRIMRLGQLQRAEIAEVLTAAGLTAEDSMLEQVQSITSGDPFYVADLVRALIESKGDSAILATLPRTHSAYLRSWWDGAVERVEPQQSFIDLMGTLAALRAPIGPQELVSISSEDKLEAGTMGVLLTRAARYVDSDKERYWLRHDRIRTFVRDTLGEQMQIYRARVLAFTGRWDDDALTPGGREYARRYAVPHLLEADRIDDAVQLLGPQFIAAKWREDGSYVSLLTDLDACLDWAAAHPENEAGTCRSPAIAVMRESARDLMRHLPPELYRTWIRLVGRRKIGELLDALPSYRGEAREPLLAVADELLQIAPRGDKGRSDRAWAGELLERTIGLLPLVRTSGWKLEAWAELCRLLSQYQLEPAQRQRILHQGQAFVERIGESDRDLKAICFGHLAVAVLPYDRSEALTSVQQAEETSRGIPDTERATVYARAFPAYRALDPAGASELAVSALGLLDGRPVGAFSMDPYLELLDAWATPDDAASIKEVRDQAERILASRRKQNFIPPALLLRLGLLDLALKTLRLMAVREPDQVAEHVAACLVAAPGHRDEICKAVLSAFTNTTAPSPVVTVLLRCGAVKRAIVELRRLSTADLVNDLPHLVQAALAGLEGGERDAILDTLLRHLDQVTGEKGAELSAQCALALARAGHPRAQRVFASALHRGLSSLPEGDADDVRYLAVLALGHAGEYEVAEAMASGCEWLHGRVAALVAVLKTIPAGSPAQTKVAAHIRAELSKAGDDTFLSEAQSIAVEAGELLLAAESSEWPPLAELLQNSKSLSVLASVARLSAKGRSDVMTERARELTKRLISAEHPNLRDARAVCALVVEAGRNDSAASKLMNDLLKWPRRLQGVLRMSVIGALLPGVAELDQPRAGRAFKQALRRVRPHATPRKPEGPGQTAAAALIRLMNELTGNRVPWVSELQSLLEGLVAAALHLPADTLEELLSQAWSQLLTSRANPYEFEAASRAYFTSVASLDPGSSSTVRGVIEASFPTVQASLDPAVVSDLFRQMIFNLGISGHFEAARWMAHNIGDEDSRVWAESLIKTFEFVRALGDLSDVEKAFIEKAEEKAIAAMVIKYIREGNQDEALNGLIGFLKEGRVRYVLLTRAVHLVPVALSRWGVSGVRSIVDALSAFDTSLIAAAGLVGAGQQGKPMPT